MLSKDELASCKAEEIPLRKNWWLSIQNERGSEKFEAFDFIKIKLTSGDIEIPVTSIMVRAIDGLVMESHSIVSKLIHMNIKAQEQEVADLEKENERLKLYQYTIECEAQHNKNLHEEELFNSDNLLKRLNEKKAIVADLEKENERLKEAIGYLPKVPTQSYEKELARKLADLERKLSVAKEALLWAEEMFIARDQMNSKVHCAPVRLSPITERVMQARKEIEGN